MKDFVFIFGRFFTAFLLFFGLCNGFYLLILCKGGSDWKKSTYDDDDDYDDYNGYA